uniref:Uncharacterized protein n=1 Tax=Caulerpa cliftonii TaxID=1004391 RepID=A0A1C9JBW5_9CHLO|nr:hypothetical protein [Caulerpa cliftonii]AOP19333.1 hypothetical protein [Caulerpa cliftonii]
MAEAIDDIQHPIDYNIRPKAIPTEVKVQLVQRTETSGAPGAHQKSKLTPRGLLKKQINEFIDQANHRQLDSLCRFIKKQTEKAPTKTTKATKTTKTTKASKRTPDGPQGAPEGS